MGRLFGTDGVRGKAGQHPLDVPTVRRFGAALTRALRRDDESVRFLAGLDTRESGSWIERELGAGIRSQGGVLTSAGVIPTPAIAYLTPRMGYAAGVVISASHNPFEDNGIKVFSGTGEKFTQRLEEQVESIVADSSRSPAEAGHGRADRLPIGVHLTPAPDFSAGRTARIRAHRGGLCQWRDHHGRTEALQGALVRCTVHWLRAGWTKYQPTLRLDVSRSPRADGCRWRLPARVRV